MLKSSNQAGKSNVPRHLAIIMDGNGRWAESRGMNRIKGHQQGAVAVRRVIEACASRGVSVLTLFAFSSENWKRPRLEVSALMQLFAMSLDKESKNLFNNGIKTRVVGDISKFSPALQKAIRNLEELTKDCTNMTLNIAANYGGRDDIVHACKSIVSKVQNNELDPSMIDEQLFTQNLYVEDNVDLMIRTGGEKRISNFLMWQAAYSEMYFSDTLWPDYGDKDLDDAFEFFNHRERRFGMTSAQIKDRNDVN